ncbi:MAG: HAD-IA family hydrolase [Chloroflexota bacterium]
MRIPRPSVLFLDVGDTLLRAHPSWAAVYLRVLRAHGVQVDETELRAALDRVFRSPQPDLEGPFEASETASFQRLVAFDTRVLAELGRPPQPEAFFRSLEAEFAQATAWWVFEDVPPALAALQDAGIRLCVISNWSWALPELLHTLELVGHFEAVVTSARVGFEKPHRGIFDHALELMGVAPGEAVHVGDSVRADVGGARGVGITPVLIARGTHDHEHATASAAEHGAPVIRDLWGLLDLIDVPRPAGAPVP